MYNSAEGFILRKIQIGETDILYVIYTKEHGKMHARAQGVRKEEAKLRGHCEVLNHTRISFVTGKHGERLTHATVIHSWPAIRTQYATLSLALRMASLVDNACFVGMHDEQIWNVIYDHFSTLEHGVDDAQHGEFLTQFSRALNVSLGL